MMMMARGLGKLRVAVVLPLVQLYPLAQVYLLARVLVGQEWAMVVV